MTLTRLITIFAAALVLAPAAAAKGGHYTFDGGTPAQQGQVKQALDASAFDWSLVPWTVTIKIVHDDSGSSAVPQTIFLDASLLNSGTFAWGVVQHEYAHQLDFALFNDDVHARLLTLLGGDCWFCAVAHGKMGGERFASTLAWSYWPDPSNAMKPQSVSDESAALAPLAFRTMLKDTLLSLGVAGADALPTTLGPTHGIGTAISKTVVSKPKAHKKTAKKPVKKPAKRQG
jgi:hypothetical protein